MPVEYKETHKDLQTRIDIHGQFGSRNIDTWMLDVLKLERGVRILDVGCGSGKQLAAFHQYLEGEAEIVGGDISAELLQEARTLAVKLGETVDVVELDFNKPFDFMDGQFDLVSCCFAIYYAADIPLTIGEMRRVLKLGGRVFTTGPMPENKQLFYDVIRTATGAEIPPMPGSSRYDSEILSTIRDLFDPVEVVRFDNPLKFNEVEPFVSYVGASLSEDRKLWTGLFDTAGEYESVMEKIEHEAQKRLDADGELVMTKVVGGFIGTKSEN